MRRLLPLLVLLPIPFASAAHADGCPPANCGTTSVAPPGSKLVFVFPNGRQGPLWAYDLGTGRKRFVLPSGMLSADGKVFVSAVQARQRHTLRPLRHANGPRAADTNGSGILERCRNLGRRSQDRPFQVPERCAGDDLHAGRPGTVGHRSPPWHVPARFPLAGRASSLPRPLEPHGPLRPPAVRPRDQTSDPDSARRAGREDDRPSNQRGGDAGWPLAAHPLRQEQTGTRFVHALDLRTGVAHCIDLPLLADLTTRLTALALVARPSARCT